MFCFITSLRSKQVSDNWPRVCELFERTATSVFNSDEQNIRLIAVCHERPVLRREFDQRLELIQVDSAAPIRSHHAMIEDKVTKLLIAMRRVRELCADFV